MTDKEPRNDADLSGGAASSGGNRGALLRLFGVILVILGTLDIMLSWRGAFEIVPFHVMLVISGLFLCFLGAIRRQNRV